jgi:serine protease
MKSIFKIKFSFLFLIMFLTSSINSVAQVVILNNRTFEKINDKWYQIEGDKNYEVDTAVITVKYKDGVSQEEITQFQEAQSLQVIRANILGFVDLRLSYGSDPIEVVQDFINSGFTDIAEPNNYGEYLDTPNDPLFSDQWALNNTGQSGGTPDADIDAVEAWEIETGDPSVVIAIIDNGTDWTHPDIGDAQSLYQNIYFNLGEDTWNIDPLTQQWDPTSGNGIDDDGNGFIDDWIGWDLHNNDKDSRPNSDLYFHGTRMAGIVSAKKNNPLQEGIAGVAGGWGSQGSRLMILKISGDGNIPNSNVIDDAILYAAQNGAKIIQMSLSVGQTSAIDAALQSAHQTYGCFIVCAVGNYFGGPNHSIMYPAANQYVFAVAATDRNDIKASFSRWGPELDVVAPGDDILSTTTELYGYYDIRSGTSEASPHVAGIAALIWSANPNLTNTQVEEIIKYSTDDKGDPGWDEFYGWGRVNAYQA